jgi:undecaprenyl-diphosphatase
MTILVATILGIVQGTTEFIPISSSGHLVLVRHLLGNNTASGLAFDAVLQLATSFAVLVYFWQDVTKILRNIGRFVFGRAVEVQEKTLIFSLFLATLPAIIFGLLLEDIMKTVFRNTDLIAFALILGSILMYYAQKIGNGESELNLKNGFIVGLFQSLALVPGISRSGATISGGLLTGLTKDKAVRFSFLLSLPILFGSGFKKLFDVRGDLISEWGGQLLVGSLTAFLVGLLAINFLMKYLKNNNLNIFIWYRVVLALVILLFF